MKKILSLLFLACSLTSFAKIKVEIISPISFEDKKINITAAQVHVGKGIIKVFSDDDKDKNDGKTMVVLRYSRGGVLTTTRNIIKIDDIRLTPAEKPLKFEDFNPNGAGQGYVSFIWEGKPVVFTITSRVDLSEINNLPSTRVSGEYSGRLAINVEVYKKDETQSDRDELDIEKNEFARKHAQYYEVYKKKWKELHDNNKELFYDDEKKLLPQNDIDRYVYAYINNPNLKTKKDFDDYINDNLIELTTAEFNGYKGLNKLQEYIENKYDEKIKAGASN